jgi:hypothetical protein
MKHYDNVALKLRERAQAGPASDEERRRRGAAEPEAVQRASAPPPPPMMPPPAAPAPASMQPPVSPRDSDTGHIVASLMASLVIPTGVNAAKVLAFVQDKVLSGPARDSSEFFTWFATLAGSAREYITSRDAWDMSVGSRHSTSGSEEAASTSPGKFPIRPPASRDRAMRSSQLTTSRTGKQAD